MQVSESGIDDPTQFDPNSRYYDAKSVPGKARWQTVTVEFVEVFPQMLSLDLLKQQFEPEELWVVRRGNRLSVMPVDAAVADKILAIARHKELA